MYDDLAELYDLIYEDWPRSIERQAAVLTAIIRERLPAARIVADVACGIGTQALGLAASGFEVVASDLSAGAVDRAKREAAIRGLKIRFNVDDMETLTTYDDGSKDVLIACDNSVPHLLTDQQILKAFRRFHDVLKPGGLCILSVRDYATLERPTFIPYGVRRKNDERIALFQVWDWGKQHYDLHFYFTFDDGRRVETRVFRSRYYAISIDRLMALAREAGFMDVTRVDGVFFQPLILAS